MSEEENPGHAESEALFKEFHGRMFPRLLSYAFAELRDMDAAYDMAAETVAALWDNHFSGGRIPTQNVDALAVRMLTFRLSNFRRGRVREARRLFDHFTEWGERAKNWMLPTQALEQSELAQAVNKALSSLTPRSREVYLMRHEGKLSYKEIAEALRISEHTVTNLLHRAVTRLRESARKQGYGSDVEPRRLRGGGSNDR